MCRFVAYLGQEGIILSDILGKPSNSLIKQSKEARRAVRGLNADGVGIGWYDHSIDGLPGIYKSVQPAWNDHNLTHIASKIRSTCFVGHVRASTVGDVHLHNCHPFNYEEFLFVHNGTIKNFDHIKRNILNELEDPFFHLIHGQTDSEHFFALLMMSIARHEKPSLIEMATCMHETIQKIQSLEEVGARHDSPEQNSIKSVSRLNTVLTDGHTLLVTRYISQDSEPALSLYYTKPTEHSILIASEPLTDTEYADQWIEIPMNGMLLIDRDLSMKTASITSSKGMEICNI